MVVCLSITLLLAALAAPHHVDSFQQPMTVSMRPRRSQATASEPRTMALGASSVSPSPLESLLAPFQNALNDGSKPKSPRATGPAFAVTDFFEAINEGDIGRAMTHVKEDIQFQDSIFHYVDGISGDVAVERHLRSIQMGRSEPHIYVLDEVIADSDKVGVSFHLQDANGQDIENGRGAAFFMLKDEKIETAFLVTENTKDGDKSLGLLQKASKIIDLAGPKSKNEESKPELDVSEKEIEENPAGWADFFASNKQKRNTDSPLTLPEQYYQAWSRRDLDVAASLFSEDAEYDDTRFPKPFQGREAVLAHLRVCSDAFPDSFVFAPEAVADGGDKLVVKWHVENKGEELPFTRGVSYYEVKNNFISKGVDFVEPAVVKTGWPQLFVESISKNLKEEPARWIALVSWVTYNYVVFFSDWFFGQPATALEARTWEEVFNLSINFFLVAPALNLSFSPVVHPCLEGVFNLLLSWAALFAGFLSDDRPKKPSIVPMGPLVIGMQFLTSAFLLPYLVLRTSEKDETQLPVAKDDVDTPTKLAESPLLGVSMAFVGTSSIFWGILARHDQFGEWSERTQTFLELLSIDRVGSSFLVDLAIFALFQGWMVDDDMKRRGMNSDSALGKVAKFIPFFGMAAYMTLRKPLE